MYSEVRESQHMNMSTARFKLDKETKEDCERSRESMESKASYY